jgi:type II secretory pathway component HofQ
MQELQAKIDELLEESDRADKLGLTNRSMELLGRAAELETQLLKARKDAARKRSVERMVREALADCGQ